MTDIGIEKEDDSRGGNKEKEGGGKESGKGSRERREVKKGGRG
jgi:hypothetical protein